MNLIDDILHSADIVDIVSEYVDLKKSWRNYIWLCPFHQEKTPSFVVSPDKQIFKCFWCWKWWNVITFIKEIENIDFYDAIKLLAPKVWIDLKKYKSNFSQNEKEINLKEQILAVNKASLNFFHKNIFENQKALDYLQNQRHLDKNLIIKYKLGYAPENSQSLINYLKEKWFSEEILLKAGLAKKTASWSLYSFFVNRIIFPIFNHLWEPVAFSGRLFDWWTWWKYINTPETIVYHKSNILYNYNLAKKTKRNYIIVCEWYMDVIWLDRLWFDNAVATCWTALTPKHILALKRITENIIFAFDSDEAWLQASLRWLKTALEQGVYPKIYFIEWWKDFDELANNNVKDLKIYEESQDAVLFFINKFLENYKNLDSVQKQKAQEEIFDILRKIQNYSILWDYLEKMWSKLNQPADILYQQLKTRKIKNYNLQEAKENDNDFIIPALFYKNFFENLKIDWFEKLTETILEVLDFLPENNLLKKVFLETLSPEEKEKLLEKQLIWEKDLHWWTKEKIQSKIFAEVKKYLINLLIKVAKSPSLENESKVKLFEVINKLRKEDIK